MPNPMPNPSSDAKKLHSKNKTIGQPASKSGIGLARGITHRVNISAYTSLHRTWTGYQTPRGPPVRPVSLLGKGNIAVPRGTRLAGSARVSISSHAAIHSNYNNNVSQMLGTLLLANGPTYHPAITPWGAGDVLASEFLSCSQTLLSDSERSILNRTSFTIVFRCLPRRTQWPL